MRYSEFKEEQKTGPAGQAKGSDPMPQAKPGRTRHPLKDKLVGEAETDNTAITQGPPFENTGIVQAVQDKLEALGYPVGATGSDGKYGPRTARAVAAFKRDFNLQGDGSSLSTADLEAMRGAQPVANPTATGNHSSAYRGGSDDLGDVEFASGSESGRVRMQNQGATRNQPLDRRLMAVLQAAAEDAGVDVVVFSGGQDARGQGTRRVGSIRHDNGLAADVWIYSDGRRLATAREHPIVAKFIAACVANGAKGIGAGPGYMGGVGIHVDLWGDRAGSTTWGADNSSSNTPTYVAQAYRAGQSGNIG